jgi:SAM-dependent methyltransferase
MKIIYKNVKDFPGWDQAGEFLQKLIRQYNAQKLLEIGSGANPTLTADFIESHKISYTTNDVDSEELEKADPRLETLQFDFSGRKLPENLRDSFDLVFSRMVNEHIKDGEQYYKNIYSILRGGGITSHCFSTLYAFPFVMNKIIPENLSNYLLQKLSPVDQYSHGKFKAYYSWSRGPSKKMIRRYNQIGFDVIEYAGFFGHDYYHHGLRLLHRLEEAKSDLLLSHFRIPYLTAYAYIILQKPN